MAAPAPKPVKLTQVATGSYSGPDPQPLVVVGSVPVAATDVVDLPAVPASFADVAAVRTYMLSLVAALESSAHFS